MVKVLVVDDSALMRKMLSEILASDSGIQVVGTAIDGRDSLKKISTLRPDVITLDLEMPDMDGIEVLKKIVSQYNIPVVIVSSHTQKGSEKSLEAMNAGAVDYVFKPTYQNMDEISYELKFKVKAAARAKIPKFKISKVRKKTFGSTRKKIVVIASSTGGPQTLEALLVQLPKEIPAPILIVQHMPPGFTKSFAERLNTLCDLEVREAKQGDELKNGLVLIAPGGYHMELKSDIEGMEGSIYLDNKTPPELGVRPNANRLFNSVVKIFGENTIGIVLTGMGSDGKEGSRTIKEHNGTIIAQSEETCVIYGMPKEVIVAGLADEIVPLEKIPVSLVQLLDL
ncbi:MAG: chemotaxis response regulator protein-glutamate methylesterase [Candidatus Woesearchaeota archaeon]